MVPAGSGGWRRVPASQRFFEGDPAIRLGTRERRLHSAGDTYQLSWEDGPVLYVLKLSPTEGRSVREAEFREVVGALTWP